MTVRHAVVSEWRGLRTPYWPTTFLSEWQAWDSPRRGKTERSLSDMPRVPDNVLDGVAFMYPTRDTAEARVRLGGTAFLIGKRITGFGDSVQGYPHVPYLVSNRHVVWNDGCCVASINRKDGGKPEIIDLVQTDWVVHPQDDDLAVACIWGELDYAKHRITYIPCSDLVSVEDMIRYDLGVGDEIFMVGRFVNHQGYGVNRPSVRFGSISMTLERLWNSKMQRWQEGFAVEMRSRTGFSGSPVAVYRGPSTTLVEYEPERRLYYGVLGVNWGYVLDEEGENTWLNGVIPAWKIIELLEHPSLKARQDEAEALVAQVVNEGGTETASVGRAELEPSTTDENPRHREDFNRLLSAAVRKPKRGDQT